MKYVNLLPESMKLARARQQQRRVLSLMIGGLALLAAGWASFAVVQVQELNTQIAAKQQDLQPLRDRSRELQELQAERQELQDQLTLIERLREPLPPASLLALLTQVAPEEAVLRTLAINMPQPRLPQDDEAEGNKGEAADDPVVEIQLEGLAREDAAVARMVSNLSEGGVFRGVRLLDSRETVFLEQPGHEFRITMNVPLTRPLSTAAADADGSGAR